MENYHQLVNLLISKKLTLATAESCTGGLVAKFITDVPGASAVYPGGVVAYSDGLKKKWLEVRQETLDNYGAVSNDTVDEMLTGILKATGADLAVAVSGIAGPTGGKPEKPIGTVYIGVAFRTERLIQKFLFEGSREEIRMQSATTVLEMIWNIIGGKNNL